MLKVDNKIILSWNDISELVDKLCEKITLEIPNIDSVHGLKRGGMTPAVMVSHKLGLPYSDVILPNTLVIDDICDSGVTLKNGVGVNTAVLIHKPHTSCFTPNVWSYTHEGDEWVLFPWENKNSDSIQDYLKEDQSEFAHLEDGNYIGGLTMPKTNTNKVGKNG